MKHKKAHPKNHRYDLHTGLCVYCGKPDMGPRYKKAEKTNNKLRLTGEWSVELWSPFVMRRFSQTLYTASDWRHLCWTKDKKGNGDFFVNGKLFMTGKIIGSIEDLK